MHEYLIEVYGVDMTGKRISTKTQLLAEIRQKWSALIVAVDRLTGAQVTTIRDAHGWSVKDHIIHITRWERSVVCLLQGLPRCQGLGVSESVWQQGSVDAINAVIHQRTKSEPLSLALRQFHETHQHLLFMIGQLTEADLRRHFQDVLPPEAAGGSSPTAYNVVYANTVGHYADHLVWIEALIKGPA